MALPATDNFNGGVQGEQLTAYNANWTLCSGDFDIQVAGADSLASDVGGETGAGWNADAFNADQYAEATIVAINNGIFTSVAVRCDVSTPDDTYYGFYGDAATSYMFKMVNGAWTQLGNDGAAFSVAEVVRLEITGVDPGTLIPKIDGAELDPPGDQDDSDIDAGSAGVSGYGDGEITRIDNWEGGNLGVATLSVAESETVTLAETVAQAMAAMVVGESETVTVADTDTVSVQVLGETLSIAITPTDSAYQVQQIRVVG